MGTTSNPGQVGMRELLDDLNRRLRRLEQPQFISLGNWRILQNQQGQLVVQHPESGQTTVIATPPLDQDDTFPVTPTQSTEDGQVEAPTNYQEFAPIITNTGFAIGNGSMIGAAWTSGVMKHVIMQITVGSTTDVGVGAWTFTGFPGPDLGPFTNARHVGQWFYARANSGTRGSGPAFLISGGVLQCLVGGGAPTLAGGSLLGGPSTPGPWTAGDFITIAIDYASAS